MKNNNEIINNNKEEVEEKKKIGENKSQTNIMNNENIEVNKNNEEEKPEKIYKYYSSKKIRNNLPHIISPQRLNYNKNKQFSLNDIENYNIVPIVLPHIGKIKKDKNVKNDINKKIVKMKKIKNDK